MTIETLRAEIRDFVLNELLKGMVDESELQDNRQMIKDGLIDSIGIKNSIFRNSLIFQGLPPIKYQNLMYFPLFLPL